jgi:hypothetical protein
MPRVCPWLRGWIIVLGTDRKSAAIETVAGADNSGRGKGFEQKVIRNRFANQLGRFVRDKSIPADRIFIQKRCVYTHLYYTCSVCIPYLFEPEANIR